MSQMWKEKLPASWGVRQLLGSTGCRAFFMQSVETLSTKSKSLGKSVVGKLPNLRLAVCVPQIH
jgi:hypothetical protein